MEVLVAVFIVALLIALLLPAMQSAREASRRLHCANNFGQVGTAVSAYAAAEGTFPPGMVADGYSLFTPLLLHLDQRALYNAINFNQPNGDGFQDDGRMPRFSAHTVAITRLGVLTCPSDSGPPGVAATTNYAGNTGYGFERTRGHRAGVFESSAASVAPASITDGLSNTVGISEWVIGAGLKGGSDFLANIYPIPRIDDFERFMAACDSATSFTDEAAVHGQGKQCHWWWGGSGDTLYSHSQGVNQRSCSGARGISRFECCYAAASRHPGGVNALFLDGHVNFIQETVTRDVWRGLGTRAGGEAANVPD